MDILISAIAGDLVGRSMSFLISKYFQQQPDISKIAQRLQSVVLRIDTVVEEAQGRDITNQGMLCQLKMLREEMYRGHYVLDALRFRPALDEEGEEGMSHSLAVPRKSSPAKRLHFSRTSSSSSSREALLIGTNRNIRQELQQMVDTLEDTMDGMKEFLFFLELYPRMLREPYGTYLFLANCIFGRQTERRRILNFLMCPSATPDLAILPIVGPIRVGKSTLVENICRDESVRDRFSMILFFPEGSLKDERVVNLRLREDAPVYCWRLVKRHRYFFICNHHQSESSENVPKINLQDIMLGCGGKLPCGEFEALAWRSRIPPYYNYTVSCKMQAPQLTVGRKKREHQEEEHFV